MARTTSKLAAKAVKTPAKVKASKSGPDLNELAEKVEKLIKLLKLQDTSGTTKAERVQNEKDFKEILATLWYV